MPNSDFRIVVLSGPICSGKSELAQLFSERHHAVTIKTRDLILELKPRVKQERASLQRAGEALDRADGGKWVSSALARVIEARRSDGSARLFVLDSARIIQQVESLREAFGASVFHVHLTAKDSVLETRYGARSGKTQELPSYSDVRKSKTERTIEALAKIADVVVETDRCTPEAVFVRATALLGLYPRAVTQLVDALVGGQYGSEGKGNIVGHIAPEYQLLVRVGGPNAGHQVYGSPIQVYYHLPSGSERAPHAKIVLGAGSILRIPKLLAEIQDHQLTADRLAIDPQAMVIEEEDIEAEKELQEKISSTRQGVGAATARKIMGRGQEGKQKIQLAKDVRELKPYVKGDVQEIFERAYLNGDRILLEGTQGTTLSLHHGPYPHVTSRDTTVSGCLSDAGIAPRRLRRVIMVCRTYPIRVGGPSGPMVNEVTFQEIAERSRIPYKELEEREKTTTTKRARRVAEFDWEQLRRSALLNGPTDIALTFADYLGIENRNAFRFEQLNESTLRFVEEVERVSGVPVSLISTKFNVRNVIDRRAW